MKAVDYCAKVIERKQRAARSRAERHASARARVRVAQLGFITLDSSEDDPE